MGYNWYEDYEYLVYFFDETYLNTRSLTLTVSEIYLSMSGLERRLFCKVEDIDYNNNWECQLYFIRNAR